MMASAEERGPALRDRIDALNRWERTAWILFAVLAVVFFWDLLVRSGPGSPRR